MCCIISRMNDVHSVLLLVCGVLAPGYIYIYMTSKTSAV